MKEKVIVGMSGGVDSSVSAYLLQKQGYEVVGVTEIMYGNSEKEIEDAKTVCDKLGIEHIVIDCRKEFEENIIKYFCDTFLKGETPNPCIMCNSLIKWEKLYELSEKLSVNKIATGHYSNVLKLDNGRYTVNIAPYKDQSYALYRLRQEHLAKTVMPLAGIDKEEVRMMASQIDLEVANKPDSQDICFVENNDYAEFLKRNVSERFLGEGNFVDINGNILGIHKGIEHYTIGQRKGLNLSMGHPVFVVDIDKENNCVVIGDNEDCFSRELRIKDVCCMAVEKIEENKQLLCRIRYAHKGTMARAFYEGNGVYRVEFEEPVRAVTKGQSVVMYENNHVYAGGIICAR